MKQRILRYWTYFRRGHNVYLAFFLSFMNFIVIQYNLLVALFFANFFKNIVLFAIFFVATYLPLATILGWLDYKRVAVPVDTTLAAKASPYARDIAYALFLIADGKNNEAKQILRKWF